MDNKRFQAEIGLESTVAQKNNSEVSLQNIDSSTDVPDILVHGCKDEPGSSSFDWSSEVDVNVDNEIIDRDHASILESDVGINQVQINVSTNIDIGSHGSNCKRVQYCLKESEDSTTGVSFTQLSKEIPTAKVTFFIKGEDRHKRFKVVMRPKDCISKGFKAYIRKYEGSSISKTNLEFTYNGMILSGDEKVACFRGSTIMARQMYD